MMPVQIDLKKVITDNPKVNSEELKKGQDALRELYRSGIVRRSTYDLDTPESKRDLRFDDEIVEIANFRRLQK